MRIKEFVRCINTTEPQKIKKGWEKARLTVNLSQSLTVNLSQSLTESFDFDRELENEDAEEEFCCTLCAMEELNLDSESETESDDVVEIVPEGVPEAVEEQKTQKQSQITDFFRSKK